MSRMDPGLKAKWLEALRSGRYNQGMNRLCIEGSFCCLGVLSDVMGIPYTEEQDVFDMRPQRLYDFSAIDTDFEPDGLSTETIPNKILLPMKDADACDHLCTLMNMNDEGVPFEGIADYIEEHL